MKIVADENIPHIKHYFAGLGEIIFKSGRQIEPSDVQNADMLLVRSITEVDENLLQGSTVKFVGSATTGVDHLDIAYLESKGIQWVSAAGFNATAVAEYVVCIVAALQKQGALLGKAPRAGVIGVGRIGQLVVDKLKILGFDVVQCDPIREREDPNFHSVQLNQLDNLDFITLHTPLTHNGQFPTYHMIDEAFLKRQKAGCIILNTGRGAAINFEDAKAYGQHLQWCLDVWEGEPKIDHDMLNLVRIATPHIAGYSMQSKYRGVEMIYQSAVKMGVIPTSVLKTSVPLPAKKISLAELSVSWRDVVLKLYDPVQTSFQMKKSLFDASMTFDQLRKNFIERYEFAHIGVLDAQVSKHDSTLLQQLGFLM